MSLQKPYTKNLFLSFLALFIMGVVTFYSCQKEISCEGCTDGNKPPIAIAGPDQIITLPTDSVLLNGNSSSDPDGTIAKWLWTKISGPASFNIVKPSDSTTKVKILVIGTYQFELKVTDNGGLSAKDTLQVIVKDPFQPNRPPIANAGADQTITLPTNTITLNGNGSTDPDNNITSYLWTKISGPSSFNIANANIVQTQVANLIEGIYQFELKVTDAGGLFSKDTMQVTVNHDINNPSVDIYVAGDENGVSVYWKNGQAIPLNNGSAGYGYYGTSIAVAGSDVCVSATKIGLLWDEYAAQYWKNGLGVQLGNYAGVNSIALSGSDVYVAGWEWENAGSKTVAKYWKNGQAVSLSNGTTDAEATAITVVGNDVYVAGDINGIAKYWKNGQEVSLTDGSQQAFANSITVVGSDVYVAGSDGGAAKYWKNGSAVPLSQGYATSVAVAGNDVYVAGYDGNYYTYRAKYWKNGQEVLLTNGTTPEIAFSIAVHNDDVYIAVTDYFFDTGNRVAKYFKNGQVVLLSSHGTAHSIVVVDH